jgi:hypothetical protein
VLRTLTGAGRRHELVAHHPATTALPLRTEAYPWRLPARHEAARIFVSCLSEPYPTPKQKRPRQGPSLASAPCRNRTYNLVIKRLLAVRRSAKSVSVRARLTLTRRWTFCAERRDGRSVTQCRWRVVFATKATRWPLPSARHRPIASVGVTLPPAPPSACTPGSSAGTRPCPSRRDPLSASPTHPWGLPHLSRRQAGRIGWLTREVPRAIGAFLA